MGRFLRDLVMPIWSLYHGLWITNGLARIIQRLFEGEPEIFNMDRSVICLTRDWRKDKERKPFFEEISFGTLKRLIQVPRRSPQ
jgi:hypothetical protein